MALFALITIALIGFSQIYFTKVFFISLTMMSILFAGNEGQSNKSVISKQLEPSDIPSS